MVLRTQVLKDGLVFPECPRWHQGRLWFSDIHAHQVMALDMPGGIETIVEVPTQPTGLGWLPDGRLLVVSATDRRLLRLEPDGLVEHANLWELASFHCNDMVVDSLGRAYVGNFGFDLLNNKPFAPGEIVLVNPDGTARVAAEGLAFPNGSVITPDGRSLVVAETLASRLTAYDIEPDGSLSGRRVWAEVEGMMPDGTCLDAEGAIWIASPVKGEVLRVREGGKIEDTVKVSTQAYACMLGGPDRCTLFVLTDETLDPDEARAKRSGRIETLRVEVPGAGLP
jgi:sugar lactone lactonase YvrE